MEETQREIRNMWLLFLVEAPFYEPCEFHEGKNRIYICFDCNGSTFCEYCKHKHSTHCRSIRVLKASRETAVTRKDLRQLVGTSDIQKYKINHYTIAYLRQRRQKELKFQQEKPHKCCVVCRWKLEADSTNEAYIYCSVECKIRDRMRQLEGCVTASTQELISTVMQNNQLTRRLDEGVDSRIQEYGLNKTPNIRLMEQHDDVVDATIEEHASNINQNNQLMGRPKEGVVEKNNQFFHTGRKRRRKCMPQREAIDSQAFRNHSMSSSMLIPLVAIICIGFLLLCYFRLLDQICFSPDRVGVVSRQRLDGTNADADVSPQFHSYGLESSIIQSLPIAQFNKKDEAEGEIKNDLDCAICLGEFEEGEWLRHLPICAHAFHIGCIDTWLQAHSNCPLCRSCVHHFGIHQECSVYMSSLLETLTREDFFQERATHYQNLRSQILRSAALVHD